MKTALILPVLLVCAAAHGDTAAEPIVPDEPGIETVASGYRFTEGPAAAPDGSIYFTDIPNHAIMRFDPASGETTVAIEDSGGANGLAFDRDGMLIACEGGRRAVARYDPATGERIELVKTFEDASLNSPNDLVLDAAGGIYFTDPRYGNRDSMALEVEGVYYLSRGGALTRVSTEPVRPNGIGLSPDGGTLYVADHGAAKLLAYPVQEPGVLGDGDVLADLSDLGGPDGMAVHTSGTLFVTIAGKGVQVLSPAGVRLGFLDTGGTTTNCAFAADGQTLYITAERGLKRVKLRIPTPR